MKLSSDDLPEAGDSETATWMKAAANFVLAAKRHSEFLAAQQAQILTATSPVTAGSNAPGPLFTVLPHTHTKALSLVTPDGLNFPILIRERELHETSEARAALTWRYRNSVHTSTQSDSQHSDADTIPSTTPEATKESAKLNAKIINEIFRIKSSLDESQKRVGTGADRAIRWTTPRVPGPDTGTALAPGVGALDLAQTSTALKRPEYQDLENVLPWPLCDAGLSITHPLRSSSTVLVVHQDQVFLCIGE